MSAGAFADDVNYIEFTWSEDTSMLISEEKTAENPTQVTDSTTTWDEGWYYVSGDVTISSITGITVSGTVNLILCDGATLTAEGGINVSGAQTLNIYAQSEGTGTLEATGGKSGAGIGGGANGASGTVTIDIDGSFSVYSGSNSESATKRTETEFSNLSIYVYVEIVEPRTVIFDANGGSGTMDQQEIDRKIKTLISNDFAKTGYTVTGWNTEADGSGTSYTTTVNIITLIEDITTLYAQWTPNIYTVSFDSNGGIGSMDIQAFSYDVEQYLFSNNFSRVGHTFVNWNTARDGTGTDYEDHQSILNLTTISGDVITFYAQWSPNHYTVSFDSNGGTGFMPEQAFIYDIEQALSDNQFTRKGYTLNGWKNNDSGITYELGEVINLSVDEGTALTFYAQWRINQYMVSYDLGGGRFEEGTSSNITFTVESDDINLINPVRKGYDFTGWNFGSGDQKIIDLFDENEAAVTLHAQWRINPARSESARDF